ncbi:MAG: plastocyanin/azurin family copper-binding protein [Bacteroidota bacterium]|nr:plastocyanin/azurin family copper-binding protein [Bacteroidota bacterium]
METIFTLKAIRYFALTFVLAYISSNLNGQTSHNVSVADFAFSPKELTITAGDEVVWKNNGGSHNVNGSKSDFPSNPVSFGNNVGSGWTFSFVFNTAGTYDYQCDPHAGMGMVGKIVVNPKSDPGPYTLTVNFTGMSPHVGQTFWLAVIDQITKKEIGRVKKTAAVAFSIDVPGIENGKSYFVDFYADLNKNGAYNAPPVDHAWRMPLNNITGNSTLNFAHNTTFTDIAWKNKLTVHFTGMTPHVGEKITLYLVQKDNGIYKDTIVVSPVAAAIFDINSYKIIPGISYNIDFYADHNKNGVYDVPPADHAWRLPLNNVVSDSIVNFAHNTNFTNIFSTTSNINFVDGNDLIHLYPNPASQFIELIVPRTYSAIRSLKVYSLTGALIDQKTLTGNSESLGYDISHFNNGVYFMEINSGNRKDVLKFVKQ